MNAECPQSPTGRHIRRLGELICLYCDCDLPITAPTCASDPNYDGATYCSYGHKTKASCDCGPIADND